MDQTVLRRSEPSSRTAFMGEQPNPWNLLQLQVAMSRHRGAKPLRRCEIYLVKSGLSMMAPIFPEKDLQRLPPRLRKTSPISIPSYSKAS